MLRASSFHHRLRTARRPDRCLVQSEALEQLGTHYASCSTCSTISLLLPLSWKVALRKRTLMSKQRLLFEARRRPWVNKLWRQIPPKKRQQIIATLAEMARVTLTTAEPSDQKAGKEGRDES